MKEPDLLNIIILNPVAYFHEQNTLLNSNYNNVRININNFHPWVEAAKAFVVSYLYFIYLFYLYFI